MQRGHFDRGDMRRAISESASSESASSASSESASSASSESASSASSESSSSESEPESASESAIFESAIFESAASGRRVRRIESFSGSEFTGSESGQSTARARRPRDNRRSRRRVVDLVGARNVSRFQDSSVVSFSVVLSSIP